MYSIDKSKQFKNLMTNLTKFNQECNWNERNAFTIFFTDTISSIMFLHSRRQEHNRNIIAIEFFNLFVMSKLNFDLQSIFADEGKREQAMWLLSEIRHTSQSVLEGIGFETIEVPEYQHNYTQPVTRTDTNMYTNPNQLRHYFCVDGLTRIKDGENDVIICPQPQSLTALDRESM